jgi:hypothetical protein
LADIREKFVDRGVTRDPSSRFALLLMNPPDALQDVIPSVARVWVGVARVTR